MIDREGTLLQRAAYAGVKLVRDVIVAGGFTVAATYVAKEFFGYDNPMELPMFATGLALWRVVRPQVIGFFDGLLSTVGAVLGGE